MSISILRLVWAAACAADFEVHCGHLDKQQEDWNAQLTVLTRQRDKATSSHAQYEVQVSDLELQLRKLRDQLKASDLLKGELELNLEAVRAEHEDSMGHTEHTEAINKLTAEHEQELSKLQVDHEESRSAAQSQIESTSHELLITSSRSVGKLSEVEAERDNYKAQKDELEKHFKSMTSRLLKMRKLQRADVDEERAKMLEQLAKAEGSSNTQSSLQTALEELREQHAGWKLEQAEWRLQAAEWKSQEAEFKSQQSVKDLHMNHLLYEKEELESQCIILENERGSAEKHQAIAGVHMNPKAAAGFRLNPKSVAGAAALHVQQPADSETHKKEIETLQKEVATLTKEMETLNHNASESEETISLLTGQLSEEGEQMKVVEPPEAMCKQCLEKISTDEVVKAAHREQIVLTAQSEKIEKLELDLTTMRLNAVEMQTAFDELQQTHRKLQQKPAYQNPKAAAGMPVKSQVSLLQELNSELTAKQRELQEELTTKRSELHELRLSGTVFKTNLTEVRTALAEAKTSLNELQRTHNKCPKPIRQNPKAAAGMPVKSEVVLLQEQNAELTAKQSELLDEMSRMRKSAIECKSAVDELHRNEGDMVDMSKEKHDLQTQLVKVQEASRMQADQNVTLQAKQTELLGEMTKLRLRRIEAESALNELQQEHAQSIKRQTTAVSVNPKAAAGMQLSQADSEAAASRASKISLDNRDLRSKKLARTLSSRSPSPHSPDQTTMLTSPVQLLSDMGNGAPTTKIEEANSALEERADRVKAAGLLGELLGDTLRKKASSSTSKSDIQLTSPVKMFSAMH